MIATRPSSTRSRSVMRPPRSKSSSNTWPSPPIYTPRSWSEPLSEASTPGRPAACCSPSRVMYPVPGRPTSGRTDSGHAEWAPRANTASIAAPEIDGPDSGRSEPPRSTTEKVSVVDRVANPTLISNDQSRGGASPREKTRRRGPGEDEQRQSGQGGGHLASVSRACSGAAGAKGGPRAAGRPSATRRATVAG